MPLADGAERALVRHLARRGADRAVLARVPGATLVVVAHQWEGEPSVTDAGEPRLVDDGQTAIVADASIYYRQELRVRLQGAGSRASGGSSASEAIHAAYLALEDAAPSVLEGDFAFVLWDGRRRRAVCARDFGGKRPLYYATVGGMLVVASTIDAITSIPGFVPTLNFPVLAETCAQWWSSTAETCYAGVHEVPAGSTLSWSPGGTVRIERHWVIPELGIGKYESAKLEDGARELLHLLRHATAERLAPSGSTAVWMSGGWDSSAVFATAQSVLGEAGPRKVVPVSISYPAGDPGREDELIGAIARRWNAPVSWLEVDEIPLFDEPETGATRRDLPFAHTYEHWNRALARRSREIGARVAFDGNGGDQLFQISDVFLADLFRAGRWSRVADEWRAKGGRGRGTFFDWVIAPALPDVVKGPVASLLGRRSADDFVRPMPAWIRADFIAGYGLHDRERRSLPRRSGYRGWRREAHHFLAAPSFPRAFQCLSDFAQDAGVELRSPLYDRRVVEFACTRPREERNAGRETKRLLRAAMSGLLPDSVLAPRRVRTGITTAYSDRRMRAEFPLLLQRHGTMQMLSDLGIVEPRAVREAWSEYCRTGSSALKVPLFLTMHVELWLQGRFGASRGGEPRPGVEALAAAHH